MALSKPIFAGGAGLVCALVAGCGATTSPVTSPQLQTPILNNPGDNRSNFASRFGAKANDGKTGSGILSPEEAAYTPLEAVQTPPNTFLAFPYIQKGSGGDSVSGRNETLTVFWQTTAAGASEGQNFSVETRRTSTQTGSLASPAPWTKTEKPVSHPFPGAGDTPAHTVWRANLDNLLPGALFDYRVLRGDTPVFAARTRAPRSSGASFRVVLWGNSAGDTPTEAQKKIAAQVAVSQPDFICLTGNAAGGSGRGSDFQKNFFSVYNTDAASAGATAGSGAGVPLLRSTLLFAALGNTDIAARDAGKTPDGLAYFAYFGFPLNGPVLEAANAPRLGGENPAAASAALAENTGAAFPRMANYSFDYGGTHWAVLDSSPYTNWQTGPLREWLQNDLSRAQKASWRFVVFHAAPFRTAQTQDKEQMRVLCDLLQKYKVSVVWSGGAANYQRTYPLTFKADTGVVGAESGAAKSGLVPGVWTLDKTFNGDKQTQPKGVLYVVTGAGGAPLSGKALEAAPSEWQPFTKKYAASSHSFSQMDVAPKSLTVRQVSENGKELDKWVITQ